jgi:uncharacterized membrane protein
MNWYLVIKFLHITSVIVYVGGLFSRQLVRQYAKKADDVHSLAALMRAAGRIESIMVVPGIQVVIVLGVILALMAGIPIFGFLQGASQNWLLVSNILLVSWFAFVPTVFVQRGKKFESVLQAALAENRITPELRAAMDDKVVKLAHHYQEVSLIVIVALMVLKPF